MGKKDLYSDKNKLQLLSFISNKTLNVDPWRGYCYGIALQSRGYMAGFYKFTNWKGISNSYQLNFLSRRNGKLVSKRFTNNDFDHMTIERIVGSDFSKRITKEHAQSYTSGLLKFPSVMVMKGSSGGHAVVAYKKESLTGDNFVSIEKDGTPSIRFKKTCLLKTCSKNGISVALKTSIDRVYVYDNAYPHIKDSSVFVFTDTLGKKYFISRSGNRGRLDFEKNYLMIMKDNKKDITRPNFLNIKNHE